MKYLLLIIICLIYLLKPEMSLCQKNGLSLNLVNLKSFNYKTNELDSVSSSKGKSISLPIQVGYRRYLKNNIVFETRVGYSSLNDKRTDVIKVNETSKTISKFNYNQKNISLHLNLSESIKYKSFQFQLGLNLPFQYNYALNSSVNNIDYVEGAIVKNSEQLLSGAKSIIVGLRTNFMIEKKVAKNLYFGASLYLGFLEDIRFGKSINETNYYENGQNIYSNKIVTNYNLFVVSNFDISPSFSLSYLF